MAGTYKEREMAGRKKGGGELSSRGRERGKTKK